MLTEYVVVKSRCGQVYGSEYKEVALHPLTQIGQFGYLNCSEHLGVDHQWTVRKE